MASHAFARSLLMVGFLVASPASAQVAEGQMFGTWKITCENGPCRAFLTLQHDGADVLTWQLLADRTTKATSMLLTVPGGTALPPGVRVWVSDATNFQIPFQVCDASGCIAAAAIATDMATAIGAVDAVKVSYIRYGKQAPLTYEVPVAGFADALQQMVQ